MAISAKAGLQQQQEKPKAKGRPKNSDKSSSKTSAAAAPNSKKTAYTEKRIQTEKPSAKAPMLASDYDELAYLRGTDIDLGSEEEVTIDQVEEALLGEEGQQKKKPVLVFKELEKKLILNKTNRDTLVTAFGNDMNRWPTHRVVLFSQMVPFKGKPVQSMRLRPPSLKGRSGSRGGLRRKV